MPMWIIMHNDFPNSLAQGSEEFARQYAEAVKRGVVSKDPNHNAAHRHHIRPVLVGTIVKENV